MPKRKTRPITYKQLASIMCWLCREQCSDCGRQAPECQRIMREWRKLRKKEDGR